VTEVCGVVEQDASAVDRANVAARDRDASGRLALCMIMVLLGDRRTERLEESDRVKLVGGGGAVAEAHRLKSMPPKMAQAKVCASVTVH